MGGLVDKPGNHRTQDAEEKDRSGNTEGSWERSSDYTQKGGDAEISRSASSNGREFFTRENVSWESKGTPPMPYLPGNWEIIKGQRWLITP